METVTRRVAQAGVALLLMALLIGMWAGLALSGQAPGDGKILLGAHVTAVTGGLWALAFGWTQPMLRLEDAARRRLAWLVVAPQFANAAIGFAKGLAGVHGVGLS